MGRPKQPVDLVLLNGKKHLTKEEIEQRKNSEVKADIDKIEAPSRLTKKQKERFNYLADELLKANIMANLDVESLARYVCLEEQYNKITKKINKIDILSDDYDKLLIKQTKVFGMLDKLSNQLCFNILSRCKVSIPKKEEKPKNKFAKFGAGANG
ncbi:phage terminase small subunit P27 family [Clostridium tetani]|uniref:terminase small subunit P27 family n=1 Tax=Clostridium phage phiCT19406C TaxID=1567011 RepID=UPI000512DE83|nr:phage terminase small subunit P27 family [Clostridium tetani]YP_009218062.1 terminase small subunit P27 family [Clostridium phage phiCT19406C]AJA42856.1 P27 family terminase small subunit [Clostridium phage phiCT19406C]KGI44655.1 hypothetical protein KY54_07200 [Clostridium tetani]KHO30849.1 hypothetical protein OR63_13375 [Clostridium tetani]RXI57487.1 phage terminase small subunit P27 family [Clostridium tetani]RXI62329.1 phage terminase small subunit P27 family [Clostridium tetani]